MIFSSVEFIVFFAVVLTFVSLTKLPALTARVPAEKLRKARHVFFLVMSYIFYGWWDWRFVFLMFGLTVIAYFSAQKIAQQKQVRLFKIIGIVAPLVVLGFFKYFNFFLDSFTNVFGITHLGTLSIILPAGISFYTFQSMSYTIDVIRGDVKSQNFLNVALYIAFFPQLIAGPIVKAADFIPQLSQDRNITLKGLSAGLQIFVFGLLKKIVLADNLSVFVENVYASPLAFDSATVILALVSYSLQIYFDFSGYSDMAVGCAKCLGYHFERNFNLPFLAKNASEIWRRWNISLSTWLQQYLYIPLGGNRKGTLRTYVNLMVTMTLGGLWHGASWNFVFWGALQGLGQCVQKLYRQWRGPAKPSLLTSTLSILATFAFFTLTMVFFRSPTFGTSWNIFSKVFIWSDGIRQPFSWSFISIALLACATLAAIIRHKKEHPDMGLLDRVDGFYPELNLTKIPSLAIFLFVIGLILALAYTGKNPFIYFQF